MSATKYTAPHMLLHWLITALVAVQIFLAGAMEATFDAKFEHIEIGAGWSTGAIVHAILGTVIGLLMIWRLGLRLTTQIPPAPDGSRLFQTLSRVSHWLFYAILIAMPVAGAAAWFIPSETVGAAHAVTSKVLIGLIGLHIAGAFYHQFIAGDRSVLRRMLAR